MDYKTNLLFCINQHNNESIVNHFNIMYVKLIKHQDVFENQLMDEINVLKTQIKKMTNKYVIM